MSVFGTHGSQSNTAELTRKLLVLIIVFCLSVSFQRVLSGIFGKTYVALVFGLLCVDIHMIAQGLDALEGFETNVTTEIASLASLGNQDVFSWGFRL